MATSVANSIAGLSERLWPRKYDVCGNSQQVLRVVVIFAGLAHMFGLFRGFDGFHSHGSVCA